MKDNSQRLASDDPENPDWLALDEKDVEYYSLVGFFVERIHCLFLYFALMTFFGLRMNVFFEHYSSANPDFFTPPGFATS